MFYWFYLPTLTAIRLLEVFSHLTPKDIIHLSRTSRILRDTLMMRNATSVWKAARERCGAPECPSSMSEPQWAILLFGILCQVCKRCSFLKGISVLTLCLNDSHRIAARKTYSTPILASCVGFAQNARRISRSNYTI
jgi:F-box domain